MDSIYLPEAVSSALPTSFPGTGPGSRVEFDGLADALADLGRFTKLRKGFRNVFHTFAAVDERRSAMEMRARGDRKE